MSFHLFSEVTYGTMTDLVWILIGLGMIYFSEFRGPSLDIHTWDLFLSYSRPISRLLESYSPNEREGSDSEDGEKTSCRYSYILRGFIRVSVQAGLRSVAFCLGWIWKGMGAGPFLHSSIFLLVLHNRTTAPLVYFLFSPVPSSSSRD